MSPATGLIFRVDKNDSLQSALSLTFPNTYEMSDIFSERVGEDVVLGHSDAPGLWNAIAVGKFVDWSIEEHVITLLVSHVQLLSELVPLVTAGDQESDSSFLPYLVDTLFAEDLARVFDQAKSYAHSAATPMAVAEVQTGFEAGLVSGGLRLELQDKTFFHKVGKAYEWRCCVSRLSQRSLDGSFREGVVMGIDEPLRGEVGKEADGIFLSSSIGFAYRHGLLAIGEDYDVLRHQNLSAEMRTFLEVVNPKAILDLPKDPGHWPDLDAARRHRLKFGY